MPDAVQEIFARVEQPLEPRPEFAEELLRRLLAELEPAPRPRRRFAALPLRVRVALVLLAVLVLVGAAAATYFGVRTWLSAGPRGVQFTSDFALAEIYRDEGGWFYPDFKLAADGKSLYALRQASRQGTELRETVLLRLTGIAEEQAAPEVVLDFADLADPALWDRGTELSDAVVGTALHQSGDDSLAVADDGNIFVTAAAWGPEQEFTDPPRATSLLVLRPEGARQKVLTLAELLEEARPDAREDELFSLSVAASAPDLLWVKLGDFPEPNTVEPVDTFFQVRDANGDGDWGDGKIRPLAVPPPLSNPDVEMSQMVPEPGRPASVLVPVLKRTGEYSIFRISDGNADGDALDEGEAELVFSATPGFIDFPLPLLVARVVRDEGEVRLRELVAGRLVRATRISRISESGEITDIARAFHHPEELAAASDGNIYVVEQVPGSEAAEPSWVVYRLTPVGDDLAAAGTAVAPTTTAETETQGPAAAAGVPLIAFAKIRYGADTDEGEIFVIGADGSGLRKLVPGEHASAFCQSADGRRIAYYSDEEAPREPFIYVADADGTDARKVTERYVGFWCPFSDRTLPLVELGRSTTLIRHDLETGQEATLVRNVDRLVLSADGTQMLFVAGLDFTGFPPKGDETLGLVNVDTGERRRLEGPREEGSYLGAQWSKDGRRIAYFIGPSPYPDYKPGRYDLFVRDLAGEANLLRSFEGGPGSIFWSASGASVLVCVADGGTQSPCAGDPERGPDGKLWRIDAATGGAELIAEGKVVFAGWHPSEESFAYADDGALYVVSPEGKRREVARAPEPGWPAGWWLGWSPDESYIGLGHFSKRLGVVDVETGEVRILLTEEKESEFLEYRTWWR